jgi:hypothetical protein
VVVTRDCVRLGTQCPRMIRVQTGRPVQGRVSVGAAPGSWVLRDSDSRNQARLHTEFTKRLGEGLSTRPRSRREVAAKAGYDLALNW